MFGYSSPLSRSISHYARPFTLSRSHSPICRLLRHLSPSSLYDNPLTRRTAATKSQLLLSFFSTFVFLAFMRTFAVASQEPCRAHLSYLLTGAASAPADTVASTFYGILIITSNPSRAVLQPGSPSPLSFWRNICVRSHSLGLLTRSLLIATAHPQKNLQLTVHCKILASS